MNITQKLPLTREILEPFAKKYIWWKTVDEAVAMPKRIVAQVMDIGDYDDVQNLSHALGEDVFRDALQHAEAGQFSERSWSYWHYRLGICEIGDVPRLPIRTFT